MPLDVSQVDRSVLLNSQLASVICQVRFDPTPRAGEANMVKQLRERLGGEAAFPKLDQIAEASVNVSIARATAPVAVQDNQTGWRMQSADERQVVILLPVLVTLEVFNYEGWDTFSQRLREQFREEKDRSDSCSDLRVDGWFGKEQASHSPSQLVARHGRVDEDVSIERVHSSASRSTGPDIGKQLFCSVLAEFWLGPQRRLASCHKQLAN